MANDVLERERVEVVRPAARADGSRVSVAREVITRLAPPTADPLRYFAKHGPGWTLAALVVTRLPLILTAAGTAITAVLAVGFLRGWW